MSVDYYTYKPHGDNCFVIEGKEGELLIGDQLPSTEKEAKLLCRCANRAHSIALSLYCIRVHKAVTNAIGEVFFP